MQALKILIFFSLVKTTMKFRNLEICKIFNTDANRDFPTPFKIMYISFIHNLKKILQHLYLVTCTE